MQFCDLEDLYKKFNVVKMLRIGSTERPRFNYSGDFTFPESEGDILYEKSKHIPDCTNHTPIEKKEKETEISPEIQMDVYHSNNEAQTPPNTNVGSNESSITERKDSDKSELLQPSTEVPSPIDPTSEHFEGPLTRCLGEDDILTEEVGFVPNPITICVKVFLPNKYPILLILRQDATVQDTIEKTIRKANALCAAFQKKVKQLKKEAEKKEIASIDLLDGIPALNDPPRHDSFDSIADFLEEENLCPSRRRERDMGSHLDDVDVDTIVGAHCMNLLEDSMAYELRMEIGDGECDLDFPALERGGILKNFFDEEEQNFCIVQVPDYQPRSSTTPMSPDERVDIQLMFDDELFTIEVPATSTCRQLLNEARHCLTPGRVYELTVAPEDKERLKMISEVVNENVCLNDIDVTSFRIRLKRFYDGPKVTACPTFNYNADGGNYEDFIDLTSYIFTNFEAGKYKEWVVWKVTSKGKRRKRIFAIDCDEIYIYHSTSFKQCRSCRAGNQTYIFISNIIDVQLDEINPNTFFLFYQEDESESDELDPDEPPRNLTIKVKFQALSIEDSCDIVNRIHHLMRNYH